MTPSRGRETRVFLLGPKSILLPFNKTEVWKEGKLNLRGIVRVTSIHTYIHTHIYIYI